jgi:phosphate transport system substrate-binding protein
MKKQMMKKALVLSLVLALGITGLTGCGGGDDQTSGKVVVAGSTSVQPLSEELATAFMEANDGITVEIQGGGSGQAAVSLADGIADIGALSREVKEEEKTTITKEYVIAKDGVAVIVNTDVTVTDLSLEQIKGIFTGEIKNWKEVGGKDQAITVVSREEGSGTRGAFTELTKVMVKDSAGNEVDSTSKSAIVQPSTGAVLQAVGSTPGSIGYVSMEALDKTVKALTVEGVKVSKATVLDGTYAISRPFIYAVTGEVSEAAQAFIDFVMSAKGQALIEENGFIPVQ